VKVNVTKAGHFAKVDGVMTELNKGEQELESKLAESMVKNGYAIKVESVKPEPKPKSKQTK
jgi:hypothetical protein